VKVKPGHRSINSGLGNLLYDDLPQWPPVTPRAATKARSLLHPFRARRRRYQRGNKKISDCSFEWHLNETCKYSFSIEFQLRRSGKLSVFRRYFCSRVKLRLICTQYMTFTSRSVASLISVALFHQCALRTWTIVVLMWMADLYRYSSILS